MIYTKDWAFIHIPKTAGMNLKRNALSMLGNSVVKPYDDNFLGYKIMHNPYSYWEDRIRDRWTFTIVRNPYERAVSVWLYFTQLNEMPDEFKNLNLYDFYNVLPTYFSNVQWGVRTTQLDYMKDSNKNIKCEIFRMEDQLLSLESKLGFKFTHTKYNTMPKYDANNFLDTRSKKLIEEVFQEDFEQLGY